MSQNAQKLQPEQERQRDTGMRGSGMADGRPHARIALRMQTLADTGPRAVRLGAMQSVAQPSGARTIQRSGKQTDPELEEKARQARLTEVKTLSELRLAYRREIAALLDNDQLAVEDGPPHVPLPARFESAAWSAIDLHLPLLHTLPFDTSQAAIRFAQELLLKRLRQEPQLARSNALEAVLSAYLEAAGANLRIDADASEDLDDASPEDVVRESRERKNDKRFVEARRRTRPAQEERTDKHVNVGKAEKQYIDGETQRFNDQLVSFNKTFADRPEQARKHVIEMAKKMPVEAGTRFLALLNRHHAGQGSRAAFIHKLHLTYETGSCRTQSHTAARLEEARWYGELGLMKVNDDKRNPTAEMQQFYIGATPNAADPFMDDVDADIGARKRAQGQAIEAAKHLDDASRRKVLAERAAKADAAFRALLGGAPAPLVEKLKLVDPAVDQRSAASSALLSAAQRAHEQGAKALGLLELYEDYFALKNFPPGDQRRIDLVAALHDENLLPGVDLEILGNGMRGIKAIHKAAQEGGWATREEIDMASGALGTAAFAGILDSHMRRGKPGPLRAMIEQIAHHGELLLRHSPPLSDKSLILDTNMVEILITPLEALDGEPLKMRRQLNQLITRHGITDIRLANMNVAELSAVGRLIGTVVEVELNRVRRRGSKAQRRGADRRRTSKLPVLGVPYHGSRNAGKYNEVIRKMEEMKVGETKGDADRSMMADLYLAQREDGAVPHFATADLGVGKKIVGAAGAKEGDQGEPAGPRFDPAEMDLPAIDIHTITQAPPKVEAAPDEEAPQSKRRRHPIWSFPVGTRHRVRDIAKLITDAHFQVYVVGGAVRDLVRKRGAINDVDMKTNMPLDRLVKMLQGEGLAVAVTVTSTVKLVKVGQDEASADIGCATLSHPEQEPVPELDLAQDARGRDFTLNALYLAPPKPNEKVVDDPIDPLGGLAHAATGLLRFSADPGPNYSLEEREEAILAHLAASPANFGRALKFIQRGQREWLAEAERYREQMERYKSKVQAYKLSHGRKKGRRQPVKPVREDVVAYHFESAILDMLRRNARKILAPLVDPDKGPDRKGLFIHQSGFKAPMEVVDVMQRLNFPPEAIQMVYPDNVAGRFKDGVTAFNRAVTPRLRALGPVEAFDPTAAPVVKVDRYTGRIYQYRIYAHAQGRKERLLLDVDYTDHDVPGHPSPHYHIYRVVDGRWEKNAAGLSRTGQPGEPPVSVVGGEREYQGPQMWTWFAGVAHPEDSRALRAQLKQAGDRAGITIGDGDPVDIGGKIKLPMARLAELAKSGNLQPLLQVVYNLNAGHGWNAGDNTVERLTSSGGERLRFMHVVVAGVVAFLKACNLRDTRQINPGGQLSDAALDRLFDLYNARHSPEVCVAAARFAIARMQDAPDPFRFVDNFEFYVAALKHRVPHGRIGKLHELTVRSAGERMAVAGNHAVLESKAYAEEVKRQADQLRFANAGTAAYHLYKHLDMLRKPFELVARGAKQTRLAGEKYLAICHQTVREGTLQKTVTETTASIKLYFSNGSTLAIVEVDTTNNRAHLLTCYDSEAAHETFLTTPTSGVEEGKAGDGAERPKPKAPGANDPLQYYRTPFGAFARYRTSDDGNCFFHAVRRSANLGQSVAVLRALAVAELRTNYRHRFNGTVYTDFITGNGTPLAKMQRSAAYLAGDGNWSRDDGDLVPELMARALRRTIHILSRTTGNLVQTMGPPDTDPIVIFYDGGTHYERSQRI